jgi:hypothetical protein
MIENDIIHYLTNDATLIALGITSAKIFPDIPKQEPALPYMTFSWSMSDDGDEVIDPCRLELNIFGSNKLNAQLIRARLVALLHKQDEIQSTLYDYSATHYIYWSKLTFGKSMFEPERENFQIALTFDFKYTSKN